MSEFKKVSLEDKLVRHYKKIKKLKWMMEVSVSSQNYEECVQFRDEINELKGIMYNITELHLNEDEL